MRRKCSVCRGKLEFPYVVVNRARKEHTRLCRSCKRYLDVQMREKK